MSELAVNAVVDANGGGTATVNGFTPTASNMSGRNKILNGAMVIDQRNAGASTTPTTSSTYNLDRWQVVIDVASKFSVQQNAGSVTPPAGFTNYLGVTSLSAYSVGASEVFGIRQNIEGLNLSDFGWGTANAKTVTLSFWVRSSLTGTFGGSFKNSAGNRAYPFSYTISAANTWEHKSIVIAGDTGGGWLTTNGIGIRLAFSLGAGASVSGTAGAWVAAGPFAPTGATSVVGTSGATFYITGVQLEAGSVATPFEHRQYGQELALCQRYYWKLNASTAYSRFCQAFAASTTAAQGTLTLPNMRALPTLTQSGSFLYYDSVNRVGTLSLQGHTSISVASLEIATTGLTVGRGGHIGANNDATAWIAFSSEL